MTLMTYEQPIDQNQHRKWVASRIAVLLSHYFNTDDAALLRGQAADWVQIMMPYSKDEIGAACRDYLETEERKRPTPACIRNRILKARAAKARAIAHMKEPEQNRPAQTPRAEMSEQERIASIKSLAKFNTQMARNTADSLGIKFQPEWAEGGNA